MNLSVKTVLAIDIGGTQIRTALVDAAGNIRQRQAGRTPPDGLIDAVISLARQSLEGSPDCVVVAAPGPLDRAGGAIETSANLPGSRTCLREPLRVAFGLPVIVERDTTVAALGEGHFGVARSVADYAYVTVSTGIGASMISGGKAVAGVHGYAGEIGHIPLMLDGPPCGCGNRGCLEALASGSGIAQAGRAAGLAGSAADIAAAASRGDPAAQTIVSRAVHAFTMGMVGLVNAYDPGLIVVGGSVAHGLGGQLLDPARAAIQNLAYGPAARHTRLALSTLADDPGLLGAIPVASSQAAGHELVTGS